MKSDIEQAVRNAFVSIYIEKDIYGAETVLHKDNMEHQINKFVEVLARQLIKTGYCSHN